MKKITLLILACIVSVGQVNAQTSKFGKVSMEEMTMQHYEADTSAAAVVLFEKGLIRFDAFYRAVLDYHIRIKILDESAFDVATQQIYYNPEVDQGVGRIKGMTYNLDENGKIVKTKLGKREIFNEDYVGDTKVTKFTLPALKAGSVIEYSYTEEFGFASRLENWIIQKDIPVLWSELKMEETHLFTFKKLPVGSHPLYIQNAEPYRYSQDYGTNHTWVAKDVPALKREPFVSSLNNYRSKIYFQLESINVPGNYPEESLRTWASIFRGLKASYYFGQQAKPKSEYRARTAEVIEGLTTREEKIVAIYNHVATAYEWDGFNAILTDGKLSDTFESKTGSTVEMNLILLQMLQAIGVEAYPVLISTRQHGLINRQFPLLDQFNSVIVSVVMDEERYFLDASEGPRSYKILPKKDINGVGLEIGKETMQWVDLEPKQATKSTYMVEAKINEEARLEGELSVSMSGYSAESVRDDIDEANTPESYIKNDLFSDFGEVEVSVLDLKATEDYQKPVSYKTSFKNLYGEDLKATGDFIYMNPMLVISNMENPFKESSRTLPISFVHTFSTRYIANIEIPEGYVVDEMPESKAMGLPDKSATFRRIISQKDGKITVLFDHRMNRTEFSVEEYDQLRGLYREIVEANNERIVFKKVTNEANGE